MPETRSVAAYITIGRGRKKSILGKGIDKGHRNVTYWKRRQEIMIYRPLHKAILRGLLSFILAGLVFVTFPIWVLFFGPVLVIASIHNNHSTKKRIRK